MDSRWINFKKLMTCATSTFTTLLTGKNKNPTKVADRLGQDVFTIMKYPNSSNHSIQFFWIPYRPTSQSCLVSPWNQKKYCSIKDSVQLRLGLGFHTQSRRFRATGKFKNRCETRGANMFGYDWSILSVAVTCYTYLHIIKHHLDLLGVVALLSYLVLASFHRLCSLLFMPIPSWQGKSWPEKPEK